MTDVVTGEAVVLDVRVARVASRFLALFIDLLVQWSLLFGVLALGVATLPLGSPALTFGTVLLIMVAVVIGYPTAFETLTRGRSLGKMALGLRVIGDDGSPERFRQALFRALAGFIEIWLVNGAAALICALLNERGKRLGDLFAGTIVVQERVPGATPERVATVPLPPQLAAWASGLELSRLPDGVAMTARQYLSRIDELDPRARATMGRRIADQVASHVSPPPPTRLPPEVYLSGVLAERRRREEDRLARQRSQREAAARPAGETWYGSPQPWDGATGEHREESDGDSRDTATDGPYGEAAPPPDGSGGGSRFVPPA